MNRTLPVKPKRIVVKVGTSILTTKDYSLNKTWIKQLVKQIAVLIAEKIEVILVTSGAIGAGMGMLKLKTRPRLLSQQQAAAAIGQSQVMKIYDTFFKSHNLLTAQVLLTAEDLSSRQRYLNARNTLFTLLAYKTLPIINENDTVSVDEIKFGDNDKLSALVSNLVQADLLVILSDVNGLYAQVPGNKDYLCPQNAVSLVEKIGPEIEQAARTSSGVLGTGGMVSKVEAAKICTAAGIACVIANGRVANVLSKVLKEEDVGTLFLPKKEQLEAKKRWIGFSAKIKGEIFVDQGAKAALITKKKSLLAKGIIRAKGCFAVGDIVTIVDTQAQEFARGLTNYSSEELLKIKGHNSDRIKEILGYKDDDEVVHRDNLVIL